MISTVIPLFFHKYSMITEEIKFIKTTPSKLESENVQEDYPNSFIHTHDENGDDQLYIGEDRITDNLNIGNTDPAMPTRKIGGLQASTIGVLQQRTLSDIVIDILKPDVVEPSVSTQAGVSISYVGAKLIEAGTSLPDISQITSTIVNGVWSDGTPYSGGSGNETLTMSPDKWGQLAEEGKYSISETVEFTEGGIPKDNFGTPYPNKQYHGDVKNSNTITITAVEPMYINDGDDIELMVKHLYDYITGQTIDIVIPEESEEVHFMVVVPEEFTIFTVKQFNPLTQTYDIDIPMKFVSGNDSYYVREDDSYTNTLSTRYKINFKK